MKKIAFGIFLIGIAICNGELKGFRDVQIRSDKIVTAWLGYESTDNVSKLTNLSNYIVFSDDDQDYKNGRIPIGISRFSKGSYHDRDKWELKCDQLIHCEMEYPFKKGKEYTLTVKNGVIPEKFNQTLQFSIDSTPNPSFKLNQVGYSNNVNSKFIYLSSYLGDGVPVNLSQFKTFKIKNVKDGSVVFAGPVEKICDRDLHGNDILYRLDISNFKLNGTFFAEIEGLGRSYSFINGLMAIKNVFNTIGKGVYCQRRGTEITHEFAGKWARPLAHNKMYVTDTNITHPWEKGPIDPNSLDAGNWYAPGGGKEIIGGHYEDADYDIRLVQMLVSENLLSLYEAMPQNFKDGQLSIPESENGIPDILDEALWNLKAWEYLQDYATSIRNLDGGVAAGVESYEHAYGLHSTGEKDPLPYWMKKVTPYSSFCGAAIFAQASRVFKEIDIQLSNNFLVRAERAYDYAIRHEHEKCNNDSVKIYTEDEIYDDGYLCGAKMWAAGQLFSTTGKAHYHDDFKLGYKKGKFELFGERDWYKWLILWPYISTDQQTDNNLKELIIRDLVDSADKQVSNFNKNSTQGYCVPENFSGTYGESAPIHIKQCGAIKRAYMFNKDKKYLTAIAHTLDFVLGMNPSEMSWMTGAGHVFPMQPLHENSLNDGIEEPYPGILIYGPAKEHQGHSNNRLYPNPDEMGFYRRIADVSRVYENGCEFVVWGTQMPVYMVSGMLLYEEGPNSIIPKHKSSSISQLKSYIISDDPMKLSVTFQSVEDYNASFRIYNVRGQIVCKKKHQVKKGLNMISFSNTNLATGLYFLQTATVNGDFSIRFIVQ